MTTRPSPAQNVIVYRDNTYFAGWPFNGGFWQFDDGELVVGFVRGKCDYTSEGCTTHRTIDEVGGEHVFLRSTDGGLTWPASSMSKAYTRPDIDEQLAAYEPPANPVTFDPASPDFCLIAGFGVPNKERTNLAYVMISTDRARTWGHLSRLPHRQFKFVASRPTYLVRPDGRLLLIAMVNGEPTEGRSVHPFVFASPTGGSEWHYLAPVPMDPPSPSGIMGFPLQLADGTILLSVRRQYDSYSAFTQVYASPDGGLTWSLRSRVNDWGAPGDLVLLPDGGLLCTYGYRIAPFGVRARISHDQGRTWGDEIILRDDGGSYDLGYPRSLVRPDGSIVTVYYFNGKDDAIQFGGGVRHIAATIWKP